MEKLKKHKWYLLSGMALVILILAYRDFELEATLLSFGLFIILGILGVKWLVGEIKQINQLKNEKSKSELLHLKSQVNPHFFFNTLNNLYGLVGKNPEEAQALILKLSDMMRYSIYEGLNDLVTLEGEIEYLQNYIDLHKMRYHKPIDISFKQKVNSTEIKVMPLLFIILLENAFKHGVENLRKDAFVHINLNTANNKINFKIENNYDTEIEANTKGIGLWNLKRRLELVYPKSHELIFSKKPDIFTVELTITI